MNRCALALVLAAPLVLSGCADSSRQQVLDPQSAATSSGAPPTSPVSAGATAASPRTAPSGLATTAAVATITYTVDESYPHDSRAWTQGLAYAGPNLLYEGTGDYANSSLREVALQTGEVLRAVSLPSPDYYGEGITTYGDSIIQLTWKDGVGLVYRASDFDLTGQFRYPAPGTEQPRQGWGITTDGTKLFVSDGTATIYVADAQRSIDSGYLTVERVIEVTRDGQPVDRLNELELIDGDIYANVWLTDEILRIDVRTGEVNGVLNLSGLLNDAERAEANVLNGIAYDPATDRLLVTGKYWPRLFALTLDN